VTRLSQQKFYVLIFNRDDGKTRSRPTYEIAHIGYNARNKVFIVQIICGNLKRIEKHCLLGRDAT
jgi:hypothetical protein